MSRRRFILTVVAICAFMPAPAAAIEVGAIYDPHLRPHVEAIAGLARNLADVDLRLYVAEENGDTEEERRHLLRMAERETDLIVIAGEDGLQAAREIKLSVPCISLFAIALKAELQSEIPVTGIDMRPPPELVAKAMAALLPEGASWVSFYDPYQSGDYVAEAGNVLKRKGLNVALLPWPEKDALAKLHRRLKVADGYWMQLEPSRLKPDILRLLYGHANHGLHLIGPTERFVRAGADAGFRMDFRAIGEQAAAIARRILDGRPATRIAIEHPRGIEIVYKDAR